MLIDDERKLDTKSPKFGRSLKPMEQVRIHTKMKHSPEHEAAELSESFKQWPWRIR